MATVLNITVTAAAAIPAPPPPRSVYVTDCIIIILLVLLLRLIRNNRFKGGHNISNTHTRNIVIKYDILPHCTNPRVVVVRVIVALGTKIAPVETGIPAGAEWWSERLELMN